MQVIDFKPISKLEEDGLVDEREPSNITPTSPNLLTLPYSNQASLRWEQVADTLEDSFHQPDLDAVRIMCCAAVSHNLWLDKPPVWLMLIGPSGSGKTSQVGPVIEGIEGVHTLSNLTDKTLLSGWSRGGEGGGDTGLLSKLGSSIIFWISDFSSISSMGADERGKIGSQFRELYDGKTSKHWGTGKHESWEGKCTMLIGATKAAEKSWGMMRELGERFLYVRWRVGNLEELALRSAMIEDTSRVREELGMRVKEWVGGIESMRTLTSSYPELFRAAPTRQTLINTRLHELAALISRMRRTVDRDRSGTLVDIGDSEGPGRIMNACWMIAKTHSLLMGRVEVGRDDLLLARRIAKDTIPYRRLQVVELLREGLKARKLEATTRIDLMQVMKDRGESFTSGAALDRELDNLHSIGILSKSESSGTLWWGMEEWAEERWDLLI